MVRIGLLDNNHHKKWCCTAEITEEVYRCKLHSELDNSSPNFPGYVKKPRIHELRTFGYDIYPVTIMPKKLDDGTQEW